MTVKQTGGFSAEVSVEMPEIEYQLRFERLVANLSSRFINLPATEIDLAIVSTLREIVEFLDLDRGNLCELQGNGRFVATHSYTVPEAPAVPPGLDSKPMVWLEGEIKRGEVVRLHRIPDDIPPEATSDREMFMKFGTKSNLTIPLVVGGTTVGMMPFGTVRTFRHWSDALVDRMRLLAEVLANALARKRSDLELQAAFAEIEKLKNRLQEENIYLRKTTDYEHGYEEIVGKSDAIKRVLGQAEQVAQTKSTVLLLGATGTGKELLARAIHQRSSRKDRFLVKVNCAALPSTLVESELFGRERGAYTGALTKQVGRFELANDSTIFLDEVGELPLELQAKLLRVLQDGCFERLGSTETIQVDARVIAATNRDLAAEVAKGRFREDLYYRLNVFPIVLPALRERQDDIPLLVWTFVKELGKAMGKTIESIPRSQMEALKSYSWPGNVRELRNVVERAMILSTNAKLYLEVPSTNHVAECLGVKLEDVERNHILSVLERCRWRVRGSHGAAALLGLKPTTLEARLQKLGIRRPESLS